MTTIAPQFAFDFPGDVAAADEQIRHLAQRRDHLEQQGRALVQRWIMAFPKGSIGFRLVRLAGESNTLLRWRSSSTKCRDVRGGRFELRDALDLFGTLPASVREKVLEFESIRIQLNFDFAIVSYQVQRLENVAQLRRSLMEMRRGHRAALSRHSRRVTRPAAD